MAVAHDFQTQAHSGSTMSVSEASFTKTHNPIGTPKGILVFTICANDTGEQATAVSWGGVSLTKVTGGAAEDTAGEVMRCTAWFNGNAAAIAGRADNIITVTRVNNVDQMTAVAATVTAAGDTEVPSPVLLLQNDGTLTEQSVDDGSPGTNSLRYAAGISGMFATNISIGASSTLLAQEDLTAAGYIFCRETTAGQGSRAVGFSTGTTDDRAFVHLAIREAVAATPPTPIPRVGYGRRAGN
jgi:hypothetical protein